MAYLGFKGLGFRVVLQRSKILTASSRKQVYPPNPRTQRPDKHAVGIMLP